LPSPSPPIDPELQYHLYTSCLITSFIPDYQAKKKLIPVQKNNYRCQANVNKTLRKSLFVEKMTVN